MAFFLLSSRLETSMYGFAGTRTLLLFLGTAHVPATLFFYLDKDFSEIIRRHKARYVYFPIVLTIATGLLWLKPLKDSQSGMWVFRRSVLPRLRLTSDGMPLSEEIKIVFIESLNS